MDKNDGLPWKKGMGWSKEQLRWTDKDTKKVEEIIAQNNESMPSSYQAILKRHESRL